VDNYTVFEEDSGVGTHFRLMATGRFGLRDAKETGPIMPRVKRRDMPVQQKEMPDPVMC
jgi:hypothetical protein